MGRRLKNGNIGGSAFWCMLFGSVSNRPTASLKPGATPCNSCVLFASFDILALFLLYYVEHQNIQNKRGESTSERGREKERERERQRTKKENTKKRKPHLQCMSRRLTSYQAPGILFLRHQATQPATPSGTAPARPPQPTNPRGPCASK